jgi:hypothetical protein
MAIVIRIVSADGKTSVMKSLPGLPAHLKVPAGARVEITEHGRTISLAQYVNEHANQKDPDHVLDTAKVVLEPADSWESAGSWLDSLAAPNSSEKDSWFSTAEDERGAHVAGLGVDGLLIGGVLAAGAGFGVYELTRGGGTKDTVAPVAPTGLDLAADDDSGTSSTDNITSKTSALTITGTGEVGAQVELFDGTTSLGTATVGSAGTFTKDISLATGAHSVTAKATDLAGNVGEPSVALEITIDPAATFTLDLATEDDTGSSNTDNLTNKTSGLTITGTTTADASVELFDGTTSLGTVVAGADGKFSKDISLAEGAHAVTAKVAGGAASSDALNITVDTTLPTTLGAPDLAAADDTGISSTDNITNKTTGLTIQGVVATISTLEMFVDGVSVGTLSTAANGSFAKDIDLAEGTHAITLKGIDPAGNVGEDSAALQITVDTTAPASPSALDLAADDDNGASNSDNSTSITSGLTISGNAEAGSTIELFDGATSLGTVTVGSNGLFSKDISLAVGSHSLTAKDTDVAGNVGSASAALALTIVAAAQSQAVPATVHDDSSAALLSALGSSGDLVDHTSLLDSSSSFG